MMRGRLSLAIAACWALAAVAGAAPASAAGPRQSGSLTFTTTAPGTSTGTTIDTTAPPQCHATDAEIYVLGPAACPADSRIGSGWADSDQGNNTVSHTEITHFNNQDEVVGIGVNDVEAIKTIDRTKFEGDTSTSTFPVFPGVPPPEPYTPVKELHIAFPPYSRDGKIYNRTPLACPTIGYWTFTIDFLYRDGKTETLESHSPCVKKLKAH